jgi:hypothetical protein
MTKGAFGRRVWPVLLIGLTVPLLAERPARIESPADGRAYTIDLDQPTIQNALRPAEGREETLLPKWLLPQPGARVTVSRDPATGALTGRFLTGGTVTQVSDYYEQALRTHGLRPSRETTGRSADATRVTGSGNATTVSVQLEPESRGVRIVVIYTVRSKARDRYEAIWYDDRTGRLRVREAQTGGEYDLNKPDIVANAVSETLSSRSTTAVPPPPIARAAPPLRSPASAPAPIAGGAASRGAGLPSWLPVYPGAVRSPKGRITWMFTPTAEFTSNASIREVYQFYLAELHRLTMVTSNGIDRSGTPLHDFSAWVVAKNGDEQVEVRIGEVVQLGFPSRNAFGRTGIGIRYTVPQRQ